MVPPSRTRPVSGEARGGTAVRSWPFFSPALPGARVGEGPAAGVAPSGGEGDPPSRQTLAAQGGPACALWPFQRGAAGGVGDPPCCPGLSSPDWGAAGGRLLDSELRVV